MLRRIQLHRTVRRGVLALVGLAGFSLFALGCHGGGHGPRDPAKMKRFAMFAVNDKLDDVKATPQQRQAVEASVKKVLDQGMALHQELRTVRPQLLAQWESATPDSRLLHGIVDDHLARLGKFAHGALDEVLAVHAVLTPAQRGQLAEPLRERLAEEGE
jgi:periplasmic protein CpxP/Spy